eukprot:2860467-Pleurochrysis_carterae.AAC.1
MVGYDPRPSEIVLGSPWLVGGGPNSVQIEPSIRATNARGAVCGQEAWAGGLSSRLAEQAWAGSVGRRRASRLRTLSSSFHCSSGVRSLSSCSSAGTCNGATANGGLRRARVLAWTWPAV